ncbi:MAG: glycosyltransferase [Hamadaea sp.]|uniref:glycosyltransferase n=1 Tax=Hamadaea sp. TaxID=2024425 RepID=UPI0017CA621F|nr:glycosyltransferase [Hamadaea sp.]NUR69664.1 glycosyltransferase [Hamadaea sp.]NUT19531.1 glycosyltransferase [Hamadaea sp.]
MLRCSVVIPTYNRDRLLRFTLQALARQTLPAAEFEVLVCDDGSTDETRTVVDEFAGRLPIRYFHQEKREGFGASSARNLGIRAARGETCVLLDCGVLPHSGLLQAHVDSHASATGPLALIGYVYCLMINPDPEGAAEMNATLDFDDVDRSIGLLRANGRWPDIRDQYYAKYGEDFGRQPAPWAIYWTCNVSAPTALLREIGMFDESLRTWGGEDLDVGYRLYRAGAYFAVNRAAAALHVPHERESKQGEGSNYEYLAAKYGTPITALLREFESLDVHPFNINDVIRERGLPSCDEFEGRVAAR